MSAITVDNGPLSIINRLRFQAVMCGAVLTELSTELSLLCAGREAAGKAFRLFTEASFNQLAATTLPEIQRVNLATVALQLKTLGFDDLLGFDFMDRPPTAALLRALESLYALGALDDSGIALLLSWLLHACLYVLVLLPLLLPSPACSGLSIFQRNVLHLSAVLGVLIRCALLLHLSFVQGPLSCKVRTAVGLHEHV